MFGRCHEMENTSDKTINLDNIVAFSNRCHSTILLPPGRRLFYAASKFSRGRPSAVHVYVNGVKQAASLQPDWFKIYVMISFHLDGADGRLTVVGVRAKLSDYLRFWRRVLPRDYGDRKKGFITQLLPPTPISAV